MTATIRADPAARTLTVDPGRCASAASSPPSTRTGPATWWCRPGCAGGRAPEWARPGRLAAGVAPLAAEPPPPRRAHRAGRAAGRVPAQRVTVETPPRPLPDTGRGESDGAVLPLPSQGRGPGG